MQECASIILAAGKGRRMNASGTFRQKVLARIRNKPMLGHVLDVVSSIGIQKVIVVIGHQGDSVKGYLGRSRKGLSIETVQQAELLGTADAVKQALPRLSGYRGDILILYGDTPLLTERTLRRLLGEHRVQKNTCTFLTTLLPNPTGYGRIVHDSPSDSVLKIVEEVDATPEEKAIREINVGVYCFKSKSLFEALQEVRPNNRKGEYYLTDTIAILSRKRRTVRSVLSENYNEVVGVNSQIDLVKARHVFERCKDLTNSTS